MEKAKTIIQAEPDCEGCFNCDFEPLSMREKPCSDCKDFSMHRMQIAEESKNHKRFYNSNPNYDVKHWVEGKFDSAITNSVSNPKHYTSHPSGIECKEISKHFSHPIGSAIEYLWRVDLKHESPIEDLEKAIFWINERIKMLKE